MKHKTSQLTAELIGTFALVFVGAGAVVVEGHTGMSHLGLPDGKVGLVGIAMAHGLTLAAMIYAFGATSGAHFNPAVSLAAWMRKRVDGETFGMYVGAQVAGALLAGVLLAIIFPDEVAFAALGTPTLGARISGLQGVAIETVITFLFVTSVLAVTRAENGSREFAGLAIGGTLVALIFFAGPLTGAAINPARYLGPALLSGHLSQMLVYTVGPMAGGAFAAFAIGVVMDADGEREPTVDERRDPGAGRARASMVVTDLPPSPALGAAHAAIREARALMEKGHPNEAADRLVPLLRRMDEHNRDVADSLRSIVLVLEEEHGPLPAFDRLRHRIWTRGRRGGRVPA